MATLFGNYLAKVDFRPLWWQLPCDIVEQQAGPRRRHCGSFSIGLRQPVRDQLSDPCLFRNARLGVVEAEVVEGLDDCGY